MISKLFEDNYIVVPNFLSSEKSKQLAKEFKEYSETYHLKDDPQVSDCKSKYDYISFVELLCEKTNIVSQLVGETVIPTYSYARIYKKGNELKAHVDKSQCEISLTINLDCDQLWSIWIETPKKIKKEVILHPGDAMLYLGIDALHWRDPFEGEYCNQVFLHYVRSRGPYFSSYFDKDHRIMDDTIKPKESQPTIKNKSLNTLSNYIKVNDNILTEDECNLILNEYKSAKEWRLSEIGKEGNQNTSVRNCQIINLSLGHVIDSNYDIRKRIDDILFNKSAAAAKKYIQDFPNCSLSSDSGYDLLKYDVGGYYIQHTDSFYSNLRTISMSFNLNDNYIGGELAFFDGEIQIRTPPGSVVVFPSNFMYPHEIMPVIQGTRYSIVTWFT